MEARKTTFSLAHLTYTPGSTSSGTKTNPPTISLPTDAQTATPPPNIAALSKQEEERVKVYVRVRPTHAHETPNALTLKKNGSSLTLCRGDSHYSADFTYDAVLGPTATQADVYDIAAKPAVNDVLQGYNATLFAYGQTGAGKTHTLGSIDPGAVGIIPRALGDIFDAVSADPAHLYTITLSYLQIYCEQLQDLLCPDSGDNLPIREGPQGPFVPGLKQVEVNSLEECLQLLQLGQRNRSVAFTALNAHSSRSHAMVIATVVRRPFMPIPGKAGATRVGKLFMVDLAGSERLKKSKSTGQRASEAKAINLSLTTLGMCVSARASGTASHIPFRDSKLTRLLQESLGGNARTSLVVAICDAAEHAEETFQSLQFGSRAMRVVTQAKVNVCAEESDDPGGEYALPGPNSPLTSKTSALVQSLLEKETQLEAMQAQLQAHQEQSRQVVEALKLEHAAIAEKAASLAAQQEAQQAQQEAMQKAVQKAEERASQVKNIWAQEKAALEQEMISLKADALRNENEANAAHKLLESERLAMEKQLEEMRVTFEQAKEEARAAAEAARLQQAEQHAQEIAALRQQWEEERMKLEESVIELQHSGKESLSVLENLRSEDLKRHQMELEAVQREAALQVAAVEEKHASKLAAALAQAVHKQNGFKEEIVVLQSQLKQAEKAVLAEKEANSAKIAQLEDEWAQKRQLVIQQGGARKKELKAEIAAREDEISHLRNALKKSEVQLTEVRSTVTYLKDQVQDRDAKIRDLREQIEELHAELDAMEAAVSAAEARAAAAEQDRTQYAESIRRNKHLNDAATKIQRAFRAYRMKNLQMQRSQGYAALSEAQMALGSLAQQHAELEARRRSNLALTGQTLVKVESLGAVQDLVETLVAEFLLPAKDLKAVQKLKAKASAAPMRSSANSVGYGGGSNQQYRARNDGLISAFRGSNDSSIMSRAPSPHSMHLGPPGVDPSHRSSRSSASEIYRGRVTPENSQFRKQIGYTLQHRDY